MNLDPFNLVYNALWELVERNQELKKFLRPSNRIKFDEVNATKDNFSDADMPELALLVGGFPAIGLQDTTTGRSIVRNHIWALTTGDYRIAEYNRISFELYRSIVDFACVLCPITWCNCNFVQNCQLINVDETLLEDENKGISGWMGMWNCQVEMIFPLTSLKINNPAIG